MTYTLSRSSRKTVAVYITKDARVLVRAPLRMPQREIEHFVQEKQDWILKKLAIAQGQYVAQQNFQLSEGDRLYFMGRAYPLYMESGRKKMSFDGNVFWLPNGDFEVKKAACVAWYREKARRILTERTDFFANEMGISYQKIRIDSARTRWGSCSNKGHINYSWKLIFAPIEVIDYVVIHELCHLLEHNHSERFWAHVERIVPNYKAHKKFLNEMQKKTAIQVWM